MSIVWRMDNPIPAKYLKKTNKMDVGWWGGYQIFHKNRASFLWKKVAVKSLKTYTNKIKIIVEINEHWQVKILVATNGKWCLMKNRLLESIISKNGVESTWVRIKKAFKGFMRNPFVNKMRKLCLVFALFVFRALCNYLLKIFFDYVFNSAVFMEFFEEVISRILWLEGSVKKLWIIVLIIIHRIANSRNFL